MNKLLTLFCTAIFAVSALNAQTHITNAAELAAISNDLSGSYVLDNDIDLSNIPNWTPIGGIFTGVFDGQGHKITGLTIKTGCPANPVYAWSKSGLFAFLRGATITNLGIENVSINVNEGGYGFRAGALAAQVDGATISQCYSTGTISLTNSGTVPNNYGYGGENLSLLYVTAGGLIGYCNSATMTVENCYSTVNLTVECDQGSVVAGGLIGELGDKSTVNSCFAAGSVSGGANGGTSADRNALGGLIGLVKYPPTTTISGCYAIGAVSITNGNSYPATGGLVGYSTVKNLPHESYSDVYFDPATTHQTNIIGWPVYNGSNFRGLNISTCAQDGADIEANFAAKNSKAFGYCPAWRFMYLRVFGEYDCDNLVTLNPTEISIELMEGYEDNIQKIVIKNNGSAAYTIASAAFDSAELFKIVESFKSATLNSGEKAEISIMPRRDMPVGTYTDIFRVKFVGGAELKLPVSFTVGERYVPTVSRQVIVPSVQHLISDPVAGVYRVVSGGEFSVTLTPSVGYKYEFPVITTGNAALDKNITTTRGTDGSIVVTVTGITRDIKLKFDGDITTANIALNGTQVWSQGQILHISSVKADALKIYTLTGKLYLSRELPVGETTVALPQGIYIIQTGDTVNKIVIN